jgi:predicted O-methyltransferase YrrM
MSLSPVIRNVLDRLYSDTVRTDPVERDAARQRGLVDDGASGFYAAMKRAYMPVTPDFGTLLYLLVRASRAQSIVEFGTSFGISTLFLAAALRENGGGTLVTTELEPEKARQARRNLAEAGLDDLVDVRTGDARETLRGLAASSVELLFLDGAKALYLPALKLLEPALAARALIASDNVDMPSAQAYVDHVREPSSGYVRVAFSTAALGASHGHELLMRG